MPRKFPSIYPGVYSYESQDGNDRTYYIRYRRGGRNSTEFNEPVGKASEGMTAAIASRHRALRISCKEKSNREARQAQAENEKSRLNQSAGKLTFAGLFERYCNENADKPSIRSDKSRYENHLLLHLAHIEADKISNADVATVRKVMKDKQLSPQTMKHVLALVVRVLRYGSRQGLFSMPILNFCIPRVDNQKTEYMTDTQLAAYIAALDNEPDREVAAFLRVAMLTGIRKTALLALEWTDCDFERCVIRLRGETAKNGKTVFIPMNDAVKSILQTLEQPCKEKHGRVFNIHDHGKNSRLYKVACKVRDLAGLPKDFRPVHGLRHNFASRLASSGKVDLYTLQRLLTHESVAMTERYAHLTDSALRKGADVAASLFYSGMKEAKK